MSHGKNSFYTAYQPFNLDNPPRIPVSGVLTMVHVNHEGSIKPVIDSAHLGWPCKDLKVSRISQHARNRKNNQMMLSAQLHVSYALAGLKARHSALQASRSAVVQEITLA